MIWLFNLLRSLWQRIFNPRRNLTPSLPPETGPSEVDVVQEAEQERADAVAEAAREAAEARAAIEAAAVGLDDPEPTVGDVTALQEAARAILEDKS